MATKKKSSASDRHVAEAEEVKQIMSAKKLCFGKPPGTKDFLRIVKQSTVQNGAMDEFPFDDAMALIARDNCVVLNQNGFLTIGRAEQLKK